MKSRMILCFFAAIYPGKLPRFVLTDKDGVPPLLGFHSISPEVKSVGESSSLGKHFLFKRPIFQYVFYAIYPLSEQKPFLFFL